MAILNGGLQAPQPGSEHEQLLALVNSMGDGFMALDGHGNITLSNSAALNLLNTNVLNGKQLLSTMDVVDKNGYPIDIQKLVLEAASGFTNRDWLLRYKDDTTTNIQLTVTPVHTGYGRSPNGSFVILLRDITLEKRAEEERDEFVSVAGHELRTPIAIAEGSLSNAQLIARRDKASDPVIHSIDTAHQQIIFLTNLINDLAMLSRADAGKAAQNVETFAPGELVQSLAQDYQTQATQKNLSLQVQLDQNLPLITANRLYIQEILQNFITNALKYTEKGSVTLIAKPEPGGVVISVADTGIGIGQNDHPKLFGKFYRSEDWRVRQITGTGLGLYVTSKLSKLIGAKIDFQSELDKGSIFNLHIPDSAKSA